MNRLVFAMVAKSYEGLQYPSGVLFSCNTSKRYRHGVILTPEYWIVNPFFICPKGIAVKYSKARKVINFNNQLLDILCPEKPLCSFVFLSSCLVSFMY
jgi:hypothetical protein